MAESILSLHKKQVKGSQQRETLQSRLTLQQRVYNAERKRKKKIQQEADRAYVLKKEHDEYLEQERNNHQLEDEQLAIRQQQFIIERLQLQLKIEEVIQANREAKHQEFMQVEQLSRKYAKFIKDQRQQLHEQKKQMRELIKLIQTRSVDLNKKYWEDRVNGYEQQRHIKRLSLQVEIDDNQRQLQLLEQQEMRMFEKLRHSKQLTQKARKQLDDARKLDAMTYASHYQLPKLNKFQIIMSIRANAP